MRLGDVREMQNTKDLNTEKDYKGSNFIESISIIENSVSKQRELRKHMENYTKLSKSK